MLIDTLCVGTSPLMIDKAEDREKFSRIIDTLGLQQPEWRELNDIASALKFGEKVILFPIFVCLLTSLSAVDSVYVCILCKHHVTGGLSSASASLIRVVRSCDECCLFC